MMLASFKHDQDAFCTSTEVSTEPPTSYTRPFTEPPTLPHTQAQDTGEASTPTDTPSGDTPEKCEVVVSPSIIEKHLNSPGLALFRIVWRLTSI
jgi:hypothetical protein